MRIPTETDTDSYGITGTGSESGMFGSKTSPAIERLAKYRINPELLQRARDREAEERDIRVLDAYNRFESGLQEMLTAPGKGVMLREAGAAQSAVFEVNDYFSEQGGRLRDELPDDQSRKLFMDILASRRRTAVDAVARHQSREYCKWKDATAAQTIDSILKAVNICPDAASLTHGEQLLEGAVTRLYRGSNPKLLTARLNEARQAMYAGALESIAAGDPITAVIVLEGWKDRMDEKEYALLYDRFEPMARNQSLKMEFNTLREFEGELLKAELDDIADEKMRDELAEMILADRVCRRQQQEKTETERINSAGRELFQRYLNERLSMEDIVDSGLPEEQRSQWRLIFCRNDSGEDRALLNTVEAIVDGRLTEEHHIYAAMAEGLGKIDVLLLTTLFRLKDNPEAKLLVNGLRELGRACDLASGNEQDHAASIRDFLNRIVSMINKGDRFSITAIRNDVIDDHFATVHTGNRKETTPGEGSDQEPEETPAPVNDQGTEDPDSTQEESEDEKA
ncbi:hypothetical protein [Maridesulfovibrio sp.]|uniref:hypothetical protein n=1 Tax=Maridesulfovibrio sp. TaxID=2795000 RepID=UPI002A18E7B5|nr:hypothetical protein [Maridesulfovibrio sp.]